VGMWVLVDPADLPETALAAPEEAADESAWLHDQLRRFRQQAGARYGAAGLAGDGPAIRRVRAQIDVAAASTASVLVVGPPGSGRQHVARAIHYAAPPAVRGPMVPLACSLLGADLVRSTIASLAARCAASGQAGRTTLLLSDVDQLAAEVQAELAGVFSARAFPLRLMATAGVSLVGLAGCGEFRSELAALLSTILIELPPLAGRREDLPLLAQALVEEVNVHSEKQLRGFSPEALDCLDVYSWPGNIDELARVVAEAHGRAEGPDIGPADLPRQIHLAAEAAAHPRRAEETIVLDEYLARVERELVRRALAQAKGNKAKAARLLGMTRPRLYRRMVQLGLEE
jgi:DNA-binding NtrC family response regulator